MLEFIESNPYLRDILSTLDASDSTNFEDWAVANAHRGGVAFPDSEASRAKLCYRILKICADDPEEREALKWANMVSTESEYAPMLRDLSDTILEPFINYLHDRVDESHNTLYLLSHFKIRAEWFRRDELHTAYEGDTSSGEATLDLQLRESLFEGGIDYPFSQPLSPSGQADVVALLGSDDPLVLEVKVFDPDRSKGKAHIRQGFHQVLRYAEDYNQNVGYLVVFNCSDGQLAFESEAGGSEFPSRVTHAGKTFFLMTVDISSGRPSASKESSTTRTKISQEELLGE